MPSEYALEPTEYRNSISNDAGAYEFLAALADDAAAPLIVANDHELTFTPTIDAATLAQAELAVLAANDNAALGLVMKAESDEHAREIIAALDQPSVAVAADEERRALVYLFAEPLTGEALDAACPLIREKTGRDALDQCVPIPGSNGADYAGDVDAEAVETGLRRFDADDLLSRLGRYEPGATVALPVRDQQEEAAAAKGELFKIDDLEFVDGDLPQAVMDLQLKLGFGKSRDDKRWPARNMTFANLLTGLKVHKEGEKNGPAFLQGSAIGNERKAKAMDALYIVGLDVDSGIELEWAINRLRDLKLASVVYTTHSHMSTETDINQTSFAQFARKHKIDEHPTTDSMQRYMRDVKSWEPRIVETIQLEEEPVHGKDGVAYILTHVPIPKFRILLPLAEPYVVAKQHMSQADAIHLWKGRLLGLSKIIGLPIDESCLDPSRLFYLPRHAAGRPYRIVVTSGAALDFSAVPEIMPRGRDKVSEDVFAQAAKELGASTGSPLMIGDFSLKRWAMAAAKTFDAARLIREVCPDRIRTDYDTEKIEVECPFDYEHSNAGDPEDRAGYVQSAHAEFSDSGFAWGCQHNSCKGRDRLEFVAEAVGHGWFTVEDLKDEKYRIFTVDDDAADPVKLVDDALAKLDSIPKDMKAPFAVEAVLKDLHAKRVAIAKIRMIGDVAAEKKLIKAGAVTEILNALKREFAANKVDASEKAAKDAGRVQILDTDDHSVAVAKATKAWLAFNDKAPRIFHGVERLVRAETNKVTQLPALATVTPAILRRELRYAVYYVETSDPPREGAVARELVEDILANDNLAVPPLQGIVTTPFFAKTTDGVKLVSTPGYHAPSQCLYVPAAGLVVRPVSPKPSHNEIARAKELLLKNVYVDFPFDDDDDTNGEASRAHVIAMLLQPFMRSVIDGPTPAYFISKPSAGTGAGLLVNATMLIAHGAPGEARTETQNEEEWRKGVVAALKAGASHYWLDNIHRDLDSPALASAITSGFVTGRILQFSEEGRFPVRLQWIFSGNNPSASSEIVRRFVPIFMDAKGDPLKRGPKDFVHAELEKWITANRSDLVWACLTLIQAWIAAGAPDDRSKVLPSFEAWSAAFGGLLRVIDVPGFLTNLDKLKDSADAELDVWGALATVWAERFGLDVKRPIGSPSGTKDDNTPWNDEASLVSVIEDCGIQIAVNGSNDSARVASLGRQLSKKKGAPIHAMVKGEPCVLILRKGTDSANNSVYWLEQAKR